MSKAREHYQAMAREAAYTPAPYSTAGLRAENEQLKAQVAELRAALNDCVAGWHDWSTVGRIEKAMDKAQEILEKKPASTAG